MTRDYSDLMDYDEIVAELEAMVDWNDFARSLVSQYKRKGALSSKQWDAAERMILKCRATQARKAETKAAAEQVDLAPISAMFAAAIASGYKRPSYRALGLRIKPGKNGALYVMNEDRQVLGDFGMQPDYDGKIAEGRFFPAGKCDPETPAKLHQIAADPKGEAVKHGRRTGRCSCCGRELTKHASIDAGIGPICAEKWGL